MIRSISSARSVGNGPARTSDISALVQVKRAAPQNPAGVLDASFWIRKIDSLKAQAGAASYLELIPEQYRSRVVMMADQAFAKRGDGRSRAEFREMIALNWLAKREAFEHMVKEKGFEMSNGGAFPPGYKVNLIALTINGSIVAISKPADDGHNALIYQRINEREESNVPPISIGELTGLVRVGSRIHTTAFHTSEAIGLACKVDDEDKEEMQRSVILMTKTFVGIDRQTMWRPKKT